MNETIGSHGEHHRAGLLGVRDIWASVVGRFLRSEATSTGDLLPGTEMGPGLHDQDKVKATLWERFVVGRDGITEGREQLIQMVKLTTFIPLATLLVYEMTTMHELGHYLAGNIVGAGYNLADIHIGFSKGNVPYPGDAVKYAFTALATYLTNFPLANAMLLSSFGKLRNLILNPPKDGTRAIVRFIEGVGLAGIGLMAYEQITLGINTIGNDFSNTIFHLERIGITLPYIHTPEQLFWVTAAVGLAIHPGIKIAVKAAIRLGKVISRSK